jgi:hypothetical protein
MNRRIRVMTILTLATLASVWRVNSAMAAKEVFTRTKPHVNVGTIGGEEAALWFHANASVSDDGTVIHMGDGSVRFVSINIAHGHGESFLYRVVGGDATVDEDEGTVLEMFLALQRVGEEGDPTGEIDFMIVTPSSTPGFLSYDVLGAQIHVESQGILGFRHEHTRPESLP